MHSTLYFVLELLKNALASSCWQCTTLILVRGIISDTKREKKSI